MDELPEEGDTVDVPPLEELPEDGDVVEEPPLDEVPEEGTVIEAPPPPLDEVPEGDIPVPDKDPVEEGVPEEETPVEEVEEETGSGGGTVQVCTAGLLEPCSEDWQCCGRGNVCTGLCRRSFIYAGLNDVSKQPLALANVRNRGIDFAIPVEGDLPVETPEVEAPAEERGRGGNGDTVAAARTPNRQRPGQRRLESRLRGPRGL